MGKIRGRSIKRAARSVVEKYFSRINADFENNLTVVMDTTITQNKKIRNQLAGYITHLYKLIQNGNSKGLYIKSHEEEKERKESFIPQVGILDKDKFEVDKVTYEMLENYEINGNWVLSN